MVDSPHIALRVIVIVHFILTVWASMSQHLFVNSVYIYMNAFILAFGFWSIVSPESVDAIFMFLLMHVTSVLLDIILLGIFASNGEPDRILGTNAVNTYRFSLGMSIVNLLLKPLSCFVLFRLYQDRTGQMSFPTLSIGDHGRSGYNNMDTTDSASTSYPRRVETATPYSTIDKSPSAPMAS